MKVAVLVLTLFGCLATSSRVQCQGFKDVAEIKFVVDLDDEAKSLGFTKQGLADQMSVTLERELPELKFNKTADSSVYISIGVMQSGGCEAAVVYISFRRSVRVADQSVYAELWHSEVLLMGASGMDERVRKSVDKTITSVAAAFRRDNR
jgi:hypothetical protein